MGNNQSGSIVSRTGGALDTFVTDLGPDVLYDKRYEPPVGVLSNSC